LTEDFNLNKSTNLIDKKVLLKRARAKYFSKGVIFYLVDLESDLKKSYWNSYYCAETLVQSGNKITAKYCKTRWCLVCNRIRTATTILKYSDEIESWGNDKYFVTLTIPNVRAEILSDTVNRMLKNFSIIIRALRERRKIDIVGIRKIEVTYNPFRDDYHPHFHCVIKGIEAAEELRKEWILRYPDAKEWCQDIRDCTENESKELFKYFTKVISSASANKTADKAPIEYRRKIYIQALDNIFNSFIGKRTFQSFGFKAKVITKDISESIKVDELCDKIQYWDWESELNDWVNPDTRELLTGYKPSNKLKNLLENDVVVDKTSSKLKLNQQYYDSNEVVI